jgi:hypothetical protein
MAAAPTPQSADGSAGPSAAPCPVAGTWRLTGATDSVLLGAGQHGYDPALTQGWVHDVPSAPQAPLAPASGAELEIGPDGAFAERTVGADPADGAGPTDWWELDGTLLAAPVPSAGRVVVEGSALHLVPRCGIGRVAYEVHGVLHGADTTTVSDCLALQADGSLLRTVSVSQDSGDMLGRTWYRYAPAGHGAEPAVDGAEPAAGATARASAEQRDFPALEDALRLPVPRALADAILTDHAHAEQMDEENTAARLQGQPTAGSWTSAEGLADLRLLVLDPLAPRAAQQLAGASVRMSDGRVPASSAPSAPSASPGPAAQGRTPLPDHSMLPVLRDRLAPLLAGALPRPSHPGEQVGSLLVADRAGREVRWVLFTGRAAQLWNEAVRDGFPYRRCLDLARTLREADAIELDRRIPALPDSVLDESVSRAHPDVIRELAVALSAPSDQNHLRDLFAEDGEAGEAGQAAERDEETEHGSAAPEGTGNSPAVPSLWNAVRIDLPADRTEIIRDQQREALRTDADVALTMHVERGARFRAPEDRGLARIRTLTLVRRNGKVSVSSSSGIAHRLRDGGGLASPRRRGLRTRVPDGWPEPGAFADFVLEREIAPALAELVLGPADDSVASVGSLQVLDARTGEVRWVLFLGDAADGWERAVRAAVLDGDAVDLARELQALSTEELT